MEVAPFDPQPKLLDTMILISLQRQPRYGYEIESMVANIASDRFHAASGSVYKALTKIV